MAFNVFELFAKLGLDSSEYESGLNDAEDKGSKFGSGMKKAAGVAATAVTAATGAVVAFAGKSVQAGMDFDSAMSQVAATMGTTTDQIGDLRDFAQEMGIVPMKSFVLVACEPYFLVHSPILRPR